MHVTFTRHRLAICVIALAFVGCKAEDAATPSRPQSRAATSAPSWNADLKALVPPGTYDAEWMELNMTPRLLGLFAKFQAAAKEDSAWLTEFVKSNAKDGQLLPYHEKLGLSRSEYDEMSTLMKDQRLVPVDRFQLVISEYGGFLQLSPSDPKYQILESIKIDVTSAELLSPNDTPIPAKPTPSDMKHGKNGSWIGLEWAYKNGDLLKLSGASMNLTIGRTPRTGHVAVEYKRVAADSGVLELNQEVHFRFRLAGSTTVPAE
jgi:hypothetical protein